MRSGEQKKKRKEKKEEEEKKVSRSIFMILFIIFSSPSSFLTELPLRCTAFSIACGLNVLYFFLTSNRICRGRGLVQITRLFAITMIESGKDYTKGRPACQ
eukprot:TRINITY_DN16674_c0_g1_i2.p1 TRINITY_DN16674_c0_g1~~TRINITY_DN16674_c0_g1_i2.p1  ORF type:complete len:101 (-),score=7.61 TRINITY_DN16674_c0_g1_i2:190-492(-)